MLFLKPLQQTIVGSWLGASLGVHGNVLIPLVGCSRFECELAHTSRNKNVDFRRRRESSFLCAIADRPLVSLQLSLAPMRVFAVGIELALDVSVDCSNDTHSREQHWAAILGSIDQHLNCKPPFRRFMF